MWRRALVAGLVVALLVPGPLSPVSAQPAPPPSLDGEFLIGTTGIGTRDCPSATYTVSGTAGPSLVSWIAGSATEDWYLGSTAASPYVGSFTASGRFVAPSPALPPSATADFTIYATSPSATIVGSHTFGAGRGSDCETGARGPAMVDYHATYTALIRTPTGTYRDQGTSHVMVGIVGSTIGVGQAFISTSAPTPVSQGETCRDASWQAYPFKTQADCLSFFERGR